MKFPSPIQKGILLNRYKRFMADIQLEDGSVTTVHVPNTGPMTGCIAPQIKVLCSTAVMTAGKKERRYPLTLEMTHNNQSWIGVNTHNANKIVLECLKQGKCEELHHFDQWEAEKQIIHEGEKSRLDFFLTKKQSDLKAYVEVKSVTLSDEEGTAFFPDTVSLRARKHLDLLVSLLDNQTQCFLFFLVQREDISSFRPAAHIDPLYAAQLKIAVEKGLQILVYQCELTETGITCVRKLPYRI
jgi:sugar fermentation stimulation protein A